MNVQTFFDSHTWTLTYLVSDPKTKDALLIDPVLDFDPAGVRVYEQSLENVVQALSEQTLTLRAILETHAHADHISAAHRLRELTGAPIGVGHKITQVQAVFADVFGLGETLSTDGRQFDRLLHDGEVLEAGSIRVKAFETPGHTPACMSYWVDGMLFTGDALFMPDSGTGRCDFPHGSAKDLWHSIQKLYKLPDNTRVCVGHDYQPGGRELRWETTIGESKRDNIHLKHTTSLEDFVHFRTSRDKTLKLPNLLFQSVQVNIQAGKLPEPEPNGHRYLKLPLNLFG